MAVGKLPWIHQLRLRGRCGKPDALKSMLRVERRD
jgi:hypothetical protein